MQAELDREQRAAQLVAGAGDQHQPKVRAQGVEDERERERPAADGDDHAPALRRRPVDEPVAHAPDVHEELVALDAELLAQAAGVGVQRPRGAEGAKAPDLAQELLLGEDARGRGGERPQQRELLRRQRQRPSADGRHARHRVELQLADAQHPALQPRAGAAQDGRDPVAQLDVDEGLDHVVVDAALEPAHAIELASAAGEHDQRQRRVEPRADAVGGPDTPDEVQPGAVREPEVDDREVRTPRLELAQRVLDRARDDQLDSRRR